MMTIIEIALVVFYCVTVILLIMDWRRTREVRRQQRILIERTYNLHRGYQTTLDHIKAIGAALEAEQERLSKKP